MDGQFDLARRSHVPTDPGTIRDLEHQFDEAPPVRRNILQRFGDWLDPTTGTVGTSGAATRGLVCTLLCLMATLAIVGAVMGVVTAIGWIAALL